MRGGDTVGEGGVSGGENGGGEFGTMISWGGNLRAIFLEDGFEDINFSGWGVVVFCVF